MVGVQLSAGEKVAIDDFCTRVRARFGGRVRQLALFGSRARGDANEDSDIDICVVIDGLGSQEKPEVYEVTGEILDHHGVVLSALVLSTEHHEHLKSRERSIVREIAREGIAL